MIKKNLKAVYLCTWLVMVLQLYNLFDTLFIFIGYGLGSSGLDFRMLEGIMPSVLMFLVIMGLLVATVFYCNHNNQNQYDPKEALKYVGIFLIMTSCIYVASQLLGLLSMFGFTNLNDYVVDNSYLYRSVSSIIFRVISIVIGFIMLGISGKGHEVLIDQSYND